MSAFIQSDITAAGLAVLAKGVAGKEIKFTRIVMGDGYMPDGQTPRTMSAVVSPKASIDITSIEIHGNNTVTVGGIFNNAQEDIGFHYRELALYALDPDPDAGEVLYCYGNAGDYAEWIPPTGGVSVIEKTIDVCTVIGAAKNVTAYLSTAACATKADLENAMALFLAVQALADEALAIARQALAGVEELKKCCVDVNKQLQEHTGKIQTLWDAVFSNITTNPFLITFEDLDGVELYNGIWNTTAHRLEC